MTIRKKLGALERLTGPRKRRRAELGVSVVDQDGRCWHYDPSTDTGIEVPKDAPRGQCATALGPLGASIEQLRSILGLEGPTRLVTLAEQSLGDDED